MSTARCAPLLPALVATLLVVGCGSSSSPSPSPAPTAVAPTSPTPPPGATPVPGSRAAFIATADRRCTVAHQRLDSRPAPRSLVETIHYLDGTIQVDTNLEAELRALTPPANDAATVASILDDFHSLIVAATAIRQHAAAGDATATDAGLTELQTKIQAVAVRARAFGFTACGIPAQPGTSGA